jgi:hypothetical protein
MTAFLRALAVAAVVLAAAMPHAWAAYVFDTYWELQNELTECKIGKALARKDKLLAEAEERFYQDRLLIEEALKVSLDVNHDHDNFVVGDRYDLRIKIDNQTPIEFLVPLDGIFVSPPPELGLGLAPPEKIGESCFPMHQISPRAELERRPDGLFQRPQVPTDKSVAPRHDKDTMMRPIVIPPKSSYVIVWDCGTPVGPFNLKAILHKLWFRPDEYTFSVNIPLYFNTHEHRRHRQTKLENYDQGKVENNKISAAELKEEQALANKIREEGRPFRMLNRQADAPIRAELGNAFIAMCSVVGALIAVVVIGFQRQIDNYAENHSGKIEQYNYERKKIWYESKLLAGMALLLPPLLVAGANITNKFEHGISIKVFDLFGATLAGFAVHSAIITLGRPTIDRIMKRLMARDPRLI